MIIPTDELIFFKIVRHCITPYLIYIYMLISYTSRLLKPPTSVPWCWDVPGSLGYPSIVPYRAIPCRCQVLINCRNNRNWLVVSISSFFPCPRDVYRWMIQNWGADFFSEPTSLIFAYESMTNHFFIISSIPSAVCFCLLVASWKCCCLLFESQHQARFWHAWRPLTVIPTWSWKMCGRCGQKSLMVARKRPSQWTRTQGGKISR